MYRTKTITSGGSEQDFISAFVSAINAENDSRIVCATDTVGGYTVVTITIYGDFVITLTRGSANTYTTSCYKVTSTLNSGGDEYLYFSNSYLSQSTNASRTFKYSIYSNSNCVFIRFGSYNTSMVSPDDSAAAYTAIKDFIVAKNNNDYYCTYSFRNSSSIKSVIDSTFKKPTNAGWTEFDNFTAYDRLGYTNNGNDPYLVERIPNKAFLSGNTTNKGVVLTCLQDCSTVGRDQVIKIGSKMYYSIDDHTIMEV